MGVITYQYWDQSWSMLVKEYWDQSWSMLVKEYWDQSWSMLVIGVPGVYAVNKLQQALWLQVWIRHGVMTFPTWWHHQMETFSAWLAICAGNSPVPREFPAQRPVTQSFGVFFHLRLNKQSSKQSWGWWFEMLCAHYDVMETSYRLSSWALLVKWHSGVYLRTPLVISQHWLTQWLGAVRQQAIN